MVAVECNRGLNRKTRADQLVSIEGETDENGEFKVELPSSIVSSILLSSSLTDHNSILKGYCSARLVSSPHEKCNVPFPIRSSSDQLSLTSDCNGIRTFTFPSLSYRSQSKLCVISAGSSSDPLLHLPHDPRPPVLGFPLRHLLQRKPVTLKTSPPPP